MLLGKSIQHVHRYAGFIQTVENGFFLCIEYLKHFKCFPEKGRVDELFYSSVEEIFIQMFPESIRDGVDTQCFFIGLDVVTRAIDLVSGQLQQMKLLMDDTNAPVWSGSLNRSLVVVESGRTGCNESKIDDGSKRKKKDPG